MPSTRSPQFKNITTSPQPGGWVSLTASLKGRKHRGRSDAELLRRSFQELPAPFRYFRTGREILVLGELRGGEDEPSEQLDARVRRRLISPAPPHTEAARESTVESTLEELVEGALDTLPASWTRRESGWSVALSGEGELEIAVQPAAELRGIEVHCVLLHQDEPLPQVSQDAMAAYLLRASAQLRRVRFQLAPTKVVACDFTEPPDIADDLPTSIRAVAHARTRVAQELRALAHPEVAEAVLEGWSRRNTPPT